MPFTLRQSERSTVPLMKDQTAFLNYAREAFERFKSRVCEVRKQISRHEIYGKILD